VSDPQTLASALRRFERVVHNSLFAREAFLRRLMDPRRDIDDECGHPKSVTVEDYQDLYDRDAVSTRAVEVFPRESWQVQPKVYEVEQESITTPFEEAFHALGEQLRGESSWYNEEGGSPIWEYLQRIDILSGIGQYGVLLLGLDDGAELSEPVPMRTRDSQDVSLRKLLYVRCFPEMLANIVEFENDRSNPRYGQPKMYQITFNDPREGVVTGGLGYNTSTMDVHWTRCIHVADNLGSSEIFGAPRMRPILNRLLDLRKLYGGSAEMYYKGAFPGISFETHPELGGEVDMDDTEIKEMAENYMNSLQRYLLTWGFTAKSLAPQVVDPSAQIRVQIEAVCIRLGIPKRVFMGSERGELASTQDDAAWNDRLRQRETGYLTPRLIVPVINRLIATGVLPVPNYRRKQSGFCVHWPDLESQTETERSNNAAKRTQAMMQYVTGNVQTLITPVDFFTYFMRLEPNEAQAVVDAAKKEAEKRKAEEEAAKAEQLAQAQAAQAAQGGGPPRPGSPVPPPGGQQQQSGVTPPGGFPNRSSGTNLGGQTNNG
jgi:hypothetical protein